MDTTHKKMHQTNWLLPRKVKHAFLIVVADKQERIALAVHYCILASQNPQVLVVPCTERWFRSRKSKLFGGQIAVPGVCCLASPLSRLHVAPRHQSLRRSAACVPSSAYSAFLRVCPLCLSGRSSPVASAFCSRERLRRFFVKSRSRSSQLHICRSPLALLLFSLKAGRCRRSATLSHEMDVGRQNWGKIATLRCPSRPFRTKWTLDVKNWEKLRLLSAARNPFAQNGRWTSKTDKNCDFT